MMTPSAEPFEAPKLAVAPRLPAPTPFWGVLGLWLAAVVVLVARLWRLSGATFPDHDSGRNWLIAQQIAQGNFHDLFVHASPTFYLLLAPLVQGLGADHFRWLLYLNAFLNTLALAWMARTTSRWAGLTWPDQALLTLVLGLSTCYTFAAREFSITAPALLVMAAAFHFYWCRMTAATPRRRRAFFLRAVAVVAFGLTLNYKLVLLLPVGAVLEWSRRREGTLTWGVAGAALAILAAPFAVYLVVAVAVGLPWYRLPAAWLLIIFRRTATWQPPTGGGDWLFYARYLLRFESPLALFGVVAGPWLLFQRGGGRLARPLLGLLIGLGVGGLVLMSLLADKAPRGLVLTLAPLLALGALGVWQAFGPTRRRLARVVLATAVLAQSSILWREVWAWQPPRTAVPAHIQVATWLRQHGARRVATTAALGIAPYAAAAGIDVFDAPTPDSLAALIRYHGCRYVLLDDYRLAAGLDALGAGVGGQVVLTVADPSELSPYLFLEHADFVHESYAHALERQQRALPRQWQLILLDTQPTRSRR